MTEIWKNVKGYEGIYQVSNLGRVKSLDRFGSDDRKLKGKLIKCGVNVAGYKFVILRKDNESKNIMIHRLVAWAFLSNENDLSDVNHKDGNKQNNCMGNLEWCTRSYNLKHALKIGLVNNQCKIRRKVHIVGNDIDKVFSTIQESCKFFGYSKSWLGNYSRKHGNPCNYKGYNITIGGRYV